jgi:hypothetical protein
MISCGFMGAAADGCVDSCFVPRCGGEDHRDSARAKVPQEALRGMVYLESTKITPLSSGSDYLLPAKLR